MPNPKGGRIVAQTEVFNVHGHLSCVGRVETSDHLGVSLGAVDRDAVDHEI